MGRAGRVETRGAADAQILGRESERDPAAESENGLADRQGRDRGVWAGLAVVLSSPGYSLASREKKSRGRARRSPWQEARPAIVSFLVGLNVRRELAFEPGIRARALSRCHFVARSGFGVCACACVGGGDNILLFYLTGFHIFYSPPLVH